MELQQQSEQQVRKITRTTRLKSATHRPAGILVVAFLTVTGLAGFASVDNVDNSYVAINGSVIDDVIEHTFKVRPGGELVVDTEKGSVEVEVGSSSEVRVVIERKSRGASMDDIERLGFDFDQEGNRVRVLGKYDGIRPQGKANRFDIHIRILVPEKYDISLKTSGGSVEVDDVIGNVEARTSGGSMTFGRIDGPVNARTSGGSITLEESTSNAVLHTSGGSITLGRVRGTVDANTSGGMIRIDRAEASVLAKTSGGRISVNEVRGSIEATTSGGGIDVYISEQPRSDSRLSTGGGQIKVSLAPSLKLDIRARASGGGVRSSGLKIDTIGKVSRNQLAGTMNGGGPVLDLKTSGGGITIRSSK